MNKPFLKQLAKLSYVDFATLELHLHLARQVRNLYNKEGLSIEYICKALNIDPNKFSNVIVGAYPFDLNFSINLQVLIESIYREKAKIHAEKEGVQFNINLLPSH